MGASRWVTIGFTLAGVLLAIVLTKALAGVLDLFRIPDYAVVGGHITVSVIVGWVAAAVITVMYYRNEKYNTLAHEVVQELKKVTWPTWPETRAATVVVIIATVIISIMLYLFDFVWSGLTGLIYNHPA